MKKTRVARTSDEKDPATACLCVHPVADHDIDGWCRLCDCNVRDRIFGAPL